MGSLEGVDKELGLWDYIEAGIGTSLLGWPGTKLTGLKKLVGKRPLRN